MATPGRRAALDAVEGRARGLECVKLTLEVQENNRAALALHPRAGFGDGRYDPAAGACCSREETVA